MDEISVVDLLATTSLDKLINCKYLRDLNANHNPGEIFNGSFRITCFACNIKS